MSHYSQALSTAVAAALCAAAAHASSRTPVFRSDVELVNVAVTITDRESRYITGLAVNEFQVLEDGVPQDLKLFTHERLPLSLAILLDTSQSMTLKLPEAQHAATRFVHTLAADDEAQVIQFNERARIVQDFTSDPSALETAIRNTHANGSTGLYNAIYIALKDLNTRKRLDQLRRMAIVVLSDGQDTGSLVSDDQVLALARTSGIAVYGISLRPALPRAVTLAEDNGLPRYFFTTLGRDTGALPQRPSPAGRDLRPGRRGVALPVQPGLRVEQRHPRRTLATDPGAAAQPALPGAPQDGLLRPANR
jgi:Mg-chelatase subunit ChlD